MPLLKKKALEKKPLPEFLKDDEEVFHCEMTNEIFRDYEEFAERTILCNSMVWACSMTGKSNLTYQEAVQSEENARRTLKDFPVEMRIPVLFLANRTKRTGFADMSEDVFMYVKERYFVGETVEASFSGAKWGEYHVLQVIAPTDEELKSVSKVNGNAERVTFPPPHVYKYDLEQLDIDDDDVIEKMIVDFTQMRRKKGSFTREKCKLFLKQYVEIHSSGIWCVKKSAMEEFGVDKILFGKIFSGPMPEFENSKKVVKVVNGKKARQETLAKFLKDAEGKEYKVKAFEDAKKKQEEMKKVRIEQKQKLAEEKQKRKEENLKVADLFKQWYRPKEDLELEDQKKLPDLVPVKTKVPDKYMSDMFMILEFVNSFSKILHTKDFFPGGFTLDIIERALIEKEVAGPLIDLIQMLLNAIFAQQEEEKTHVRINLEETKDKKDISETPTLYDCSKFATVACKFPKKYQGFHLDKLPMYSLTVSEILRLHLLSSGARVTEPGARWCYQYRGGYTNEDDPGLFMRFREPHILRALQYRNIVELSMKNKLKIVSCLIDQLLTYADIRDIIDERIESSKQQKVDLRNAQLTEKKRLADVAATKARIRGDIQLTPEEIKLKLKKIEQDNEKHNADYEKKINMFKSNSDYQVVLGYDRALRRYLKLDSIPGIFVDTSERYPGVCFDEPISQIPELIDADRQVILSHLYKHSEDVNTSDKENNPTKPHKVNGVNGTTIQGEMKLCNDLLICTADSTTCAVHSQKRNEEPLTFIPTEEKLTQLIQALNKRGVRERELHQALENHKLSAIIKLTPRNLLNSDVEDFKNVVSKKGKRYDDANLGYPLDADPVVVLYEALVENILEMEEKIFAGNLGTLRVKDRKEWRNCLTIGSYNKFDRTIIKQIENEKINDIKDEHESRSSRESTPDVRDQFQDPGCTLARLPTKVNDDDPPEDTDVELSEEQKEAIGCLSIALAQVGHSVEPRYLKKPLGNADYKKGDKLSIKDTLEHWEKSLLASTSYSQIFLHYGTLDGCVMWSRSTLLARCRVCRRQNDSENMLLCDDCNCGYHLYCLKPKLYTIPQGEWFCPKCLHEKQKQQQLLNPEPKKKKRRIFRDEDIEDEEEEINEEPDKGSEEDKEHESGSEDDEGDGDCELCITCGSGGELLSCEKCPKSYHIECIDPPLRRMPRGNWACNSCKGKRDRFSYRDSGSDSEDDVPLATRRTARREAEDLPLHNVGLQDLLTEIMRHKDAWPFVRPVQKNEVPDYYDVISNPMDFGTIKYKLNMGKYTCDEEFMADSVLVFENCNTYNDTDADVYKCGVRLLKIFQKKCKELGLRVPEEMEEDDETNPPKNKRRRTK